MPGQTNNDLAIDALNQAIVALNELAAQFNTGGGDPNSLAANLELVAENIDATRVALETGQTASITAQNTNFADLIAALEAGCLTKYITIQRGACGGGGIFLGGTEVPSDSGIEYGAPPGYFEPTDEGPGAQTYYSRKCKVAHATHDSYREWLQGWIEQGIDSILDLQIATLSVLMSLALGAILTPVPILDEATVIVVGIAAEIALTYISLQGEVDLQGIINIMDAHRDELVCALYEAGDATQARDDYTAILSANGASVGDTTLIAAMMVFDVLNNLFFKSSEAIEAALAVYTPPDNCSGCGGSGHFISCHDGLIIDALQFDVDTTVSCGTSHSCQSIYVLFDHNGAGHIPGFGRYKVTVTGPFPAVSTCSQWTTPHFFYYDENGAVIEDGTTQNTELYCNSFLLLLGSSDPGGTFTLTLTPEP